MFLDTMGMWGFKCKMDKRRGLGLGLFSELGMTRRGMEGAREAEEEWAM